MLTPSPLDLESLAHLFRGLSHPLRLRIVLALDTGVLSPSELHQQLDAPLGLVAYHVRALRDDQLVELVDTRAARGSIESFYRLTSRGHWARTMLTATSPDASNGVTLA